MGALGIVIATLAAVVAVLLVLKGELWVPAGQYRRKVKELSTERDDALLLVNEVAQAILRKKQSAG